MSEALKTNGETLESKKTTEWDNLANPTESWQEHLKNAQSLKESESQDNKEKLFMGMKPLQAIENLDNLSKQGIEVDMGALVSMLSAPEQAFYLEELNAHGANLDEGELMQNPDIIAIQESEQEMNKLVNELLDNGATASSMLPKIDSNLIAENINTFLSHGADVNQIMDNLAPDAIINNINLLQSNGATMESIWSKIPLMSDFNSVKYFIEAGVPINDIVTKTNGEVLLKHLDELLAAGVKAENLSNMGYYAIEKKFDVLADHVGDITAFAKVLNKVGLLNLKLDWLINSGADINQFLGDISFNDLEDTRGNLKDIGISLGLDPSKSHEELERDWNFTRTKWNLEHDNYREARRNLAEGVYGMRFGSICRELVAFGAVDFSDQDRAEMRGTHGGNPEDFYENHFSRIGKINVGNLNSLVEQQEISKDDALILTSAIGLMTTDDQDLGDKLDFYSGIKQAITGQKMGEIMRQTREKLCNESAENYSKYMTESIERSAVDIGKIAYQLEAKDGTVTNREIPIKRMEGDEWMMLVHRYGGVFSKTDEAMNHPETWDEQTPRHFDHDGKPIGYVSTSAIGDQSIDVASGSPTAPGESPLFYCFTDLPKNSFSNSAEYDLYAKSGENSIETERQDFFYTNPREIVERTRDRLDGKNATEGYNEVVLNRYPGGDNSIESRLHPNYLAVFSDNPADIQDIVKKHAAYFNVPIILIDPNKYGRSKNESITNAQ